jgi:hypothetical protein
MNLVHIFMTRVRKQDIFAFIYSIPPFCQFYSSSVGILLSFCQLFTPSVLDCFSVNYLIVHNFYICSSNIRFECRMVKLQQFQQTDLQKRQN